MNKSETIGFVGLGRMGAPMAARLVDAGRKVIAWDSATSAREAFVSDRGCEVAEGIEAMAQADILITMLPTSAIVRSVLLGGEKTPGLAETLREGCVVIDMSTSDPSDTRELAEALSRRGIDTLDAPVAGGVVFAEDGTLDILVAGLDDLAVRLRPVLLQMGRSVTHVGPIGAAHALKAINNYVNAAVLAVNLEALAAGVALGVPIGTLVESVEAATTGRNHPLQKKIKGHVLNGRFATGMPLGLICKDLGIAEGVLSSPGLRGPLAKSVAEVWRTAAEEIGGDRDQSELALYWERPAGVELRYAQTPESDLPDQDARGGKPDSGT